MVDEDYPIGLSPTILQVLERFIAAARADVEIDSGLCDRLEQLVRSPKVPKPDEIKATLFGQSLDGDMIRIKTIHIEEFRGIRMLDLDLKAKNFGICGPNGTGKSGVVDAIEFCITGDVTRLSGQGSADLSVKAHAPHVDQHSHPEKANVTITAEIPLLGRTVTIHRSVKSPKKVKVEPDDSETMAIVEELQAHPEFALSRREIVEMAGVRWTTFYDP